jgi:histidinol phosphatase-like enzyme
MSDKYLVVTGIDFIGDDLEDLSTVKASLTSLITNEKLRAKLDHYESMGWRFVTMTNIEGVGIELLFERVAS